MVGCLAIGAGVRSQCFIGVERFGRARARMDDLRQRASGGQLQQELQTVDHYTHVLRRAEVVGLDQWRNVWVGR